MASNEVGWRIDSIDFQEAISVLAAWQARGAELPQRLRDEIAVLAASECFVVTEEGGALVVAPSARLLVLVANLRAQEPRSLTRRRTYDAGGV